jgi:hypothetical protein
MIVSFYDDEKGLPQQLGMSRAYTTTARLRFDPNFSMESRSLVLDNKLQVDRKQPGATVVSFMTASRCRFTADRYSLNSPG